ncbi:MAG TPA: VOC family protein [Gaiellaceae bacterium]|nr:VOC family protein [Gaiellaceae bacterium]
MFKRSYAKLPAQDVERARAFYRDVLGFEPVSEHNGHMRFECGGQQFLVFPSSGKPSGDHDQLGLVVDDVEAAHAELESRGVRFEPEGIKDFGIVKAAWFHDSEGNLISINEFN